MNREQLYIEPEATQEDTLEEKRYNIRMKILFINPPIQYPIRVRGPSNSLIQHDFAPPLGLMALSSYIKARGFADVTLINGQTPGGVTDAEILEAVGRLRPDVVGITVNSMLYYNSVRIAGLIKNVLPDAKVVFGGPHLTIYGKESVSQPGVDFGVVGEGEYTFHELLEALGGRREILGIDGLIWKRDSEVISNPPRKFTEPLDALPLPDHTLYDCRQGRIQFDDVGPTGLVISSRGCPYRCTFCCLNYPYYRTRSAGGIVDEMILLEEMGYRSIDFYDDNFNVSRSRVLEICDLIRRRNLRIPWSFRGRVDKFDESQARAVAGAGCKRISFGVESGSQEILDSIGKQITLEQIRTAFALAKKFGIATVAYFMLGLPGETIEQARKTVDLAVEIEPDYLVIQNLIPQPGSRIYQDALAAGAFPDWALEFAKHPVPEIYIRSWETGMTEEQIFKLLRSTILRFYFRPRYLLRALSRIGSAENFFIKARTALNMLVRL
jgi:anaerobic magnesium-protoporphyrin IX monomethyl ester cyclase